MLKKCLVGVFVMYLSLVGAAFASSEKSSSTDTKGRLIHMATTTSTDNTGLLDYLAPKFMLDTGIELRWIAAGTGKALEMGKNCDVDVLLVHAPSAEEAYVRDGYGAQRTPVMYNDFVIVGPTNDPAGVKSMSPVDAFKTIAAKKVQFAGRGDNSGTNMKEIDIWKAAGLDVPDTEPWYVETGRGMLATLYTATEKEAYSITDRATFIRFRSNFKAAPPLDVLVEGDPMLHNPYSVMAVNPDRCKQVNYDGAMSFIRWITSPPVQKLIAEFKLMDAQLFFPNAPK
ncbi:MAG: substrate-binding domain-containing protein [Deltaproteobacteria bacterium]|nr:substrate-binding domain-containing protein [Deltaproteobacteria bacterium]